MPESIAAPAVPRLTYLRIKNYRALRDVEFRDLTPLTILIGPNGSGKSTVLDALAFLAEAVGGNLEKAWNNRDRFKGMRTRGEDGDIEFELKLSTQSKEIEYKVSFEEWNGVFSPRVFVSAESIISNGEELIRLKGRHTEHASQTSHYPFLNSYWFSFDKDAYCYSIPDYPFTTSANSGDTEEGKAARQVALLLNDFITAYREVHLEDEKLKGQSDVGPREKLSSTGDNLPSVLYYLHLKRPEVLAGIIADMRRQIPSLSDAFIEVTSDERLLLRFRDARFEKEIPAKYASEGTMRLIALLTLLREPNATGLLGLEEPENELHPHLLPGLAEELVGASEFRQLLVATHAPALLDVLEPEQLWILHRDADGYTQATSAADLPGIRAHLDAGSPLGYLWARHFFEVGNPIL